MAAAEKVAEDIAMSWRTRQSDLITRAGHKANGEEFDPPRALRYFAAAHALRPRVPVLLSCANMMVKTNECGVAAEVYRRVLGAPKGAPIRSNCTRYLPLLKGWQAVNAALLDWGLLSSTPTPAPPPQPPPFPGTPTR